MDIEVLIDYETIVNFVDKDFIKTLEIISLDIRSTRVININRRIISLIINEELFYLRISSIISYNYIFRVISIRG